MNAGYGVENVQERRMRTADQTFNVPQMPNVGGFHQMTATDSPSARLDRAESRLENADVSQSDREAIRECVSDLDTKTTKETYIAKLCVLAESVDGSLTELTPSAVNVAVNDLESERDWSSSSTKRIYQSAARKLVGQDGDEDSDIDSASPDRSPVDERDVYTPEEFHDIREATTTSRGLAEIDFLGYTGQRISVAQQLLVGDIDLENGQWFMPDDAEGLKGADDVGNKRPLLGALKSVGEWLENHPTGNDDDYLFTSYPSASQGTPGEMLSAKAIRHEVKKAVGRAGVDKPANPHNFRHYAVTVAKTRYDMDPEDIKWLIGHAPDSNVWKTTYAHLSDDDRIESVEVAFGIRDPDEEEGWTAPPVCDRCHRPLRPSVRECPTAGCTARFAPADDPMGEMQDIEAEIDRLEGRVGDLRSQVGD